MNKLKLDNFFRDESGKVVVAQKPNAPIYVAFLFYLSRYFLSDKAGLYGVVCFYAVMLYWSWLEMTSGVNSWRKFLGVSVGIYFLIKSFELFYVL